VPQIGGGQHGHRGARRVGNGGEQIRLEVMLTGFRRQYRNRQPEAVSPLAERLVGDLGEVDVDLYCRFDRVGSHDINYLGGGPDPFIVCHEEKELTAPPRIVVVMAFLPVEFVRAHRPDLLTQVFGQLVNHLVVFCAGR
jgi:hypothetical protein